MKSFIVVSQPLSRSIMPVKVELYDRSSLEELVKELIDYDGAVEQMAEDGIEVKASAMQMLVDMASNDEDEDEVILSIKELIKGQLISRYDIMMASIDQSY